MTATTASEASAPIGAEEPERLRLEREPWRDRLSYWQMRTTEWLGMTLPRPVGTFAADAYFRLFFDRAKRQRDVVARNLSRVLGHPPESELVQAATKECFALYGRYWYDTFALRTMSPEEVNRRFRMEGVEHFDRALEKGHGVIGALPHMGNWDAAGHWICLNGYRMTAVAEELKPKSVYELFLRHRRALGMNIVPLSGERKVGETLVRLLMENHILALVADRDITGRGVEVEMFGAKRKLPAGPAFLSLGTGTPLCVCVVFTTPDGWHCRIDPPIEFERTGNMREDVTTMTRIIAAAFERSIAAAPTDWHMFQPAWEDDEPA